MMATAPRFSPPPTYAEPTVVNPITGKAQFNQIWLKWFLDFAAALQASATATMPENIEHEDLGGLQGGTTSEHYHLTANDYAKRIANPMTAVGDLIVGGAGGVPTRLPKGANGTKLTVSSGGVLVWI